MESILVVANGKQAAGQLATLLVPGVYPAAVTVASASAARRVATERDIALVVLSTPIPGEAAEALAADLAHLSGADVLLLAGEGENLRREPLQDTVVLEKPLNRTLFVEAARILRTVQARTHRLRAENRKLAAKLEEARLVGRAKCALIQYRQLTEDEAHHYLERIAMDSRLPLREVARDILRTFE